MDRRIFDMMDFYNRSTENNNNEQNPNSCFNPDYCVAAPKDYNNGILTMAFVDMQPLESVYESEKALERGTLYPNIDKPFFGGGNIWTQSMN